MASPPILALPDFSKTFVLEADAMGLISLLSRTLGPKSMAASTYEKEAMTILKAIKKWKHYFASTSVILRTDQQSLKYIQDQRLVDGIQHKLLVKLLGFNYKVEYKKGRENKVADALSRAPHTTKILAISQAIPVWMEQVTSSYEADDLCLDLLAKLSVDNQAIPNYKLASGILRYKNNIMVGATGPLRQQLLDSFHKSTLGGHSGERATFKRL
jgi:hypothetical protein